MPSNHRRRPSPSRALPRLLARSSRLAAHQGPSSPWSLVSPRPPVTGVGETAEGQPGMGKPDGSIPPPSSSIPPSGCPRPGCPPQGPEEAAGPARPGSPRGKGCLCLKVTTRARCPGRAWCLQFPGRGGGDEGPPRTSGSDRRRSPPPTPVTAPSGMSLSWGWGRGSPPSTAGGWGSSQLLSLFRGSAEGEPQWPPSPSIPPQLSRGPPCPRHPREGFGEGAQGPSEAGRCRLSASGREITDRCPARWPSPSPKGGERGEGRGPGRGGGLRAPPPVER